LTKASLEVAAAFVRIAIQIVRSATPEPGIYRLFQVLSALPSANAGVQ
jgi:hypothetical protein